jgi:hypothetical protein
LRTEDGRWRLYFMCYIYSNPQSVVINCSYNSWVSSKLIHPSRPRLQITNTHANIICCVTLLLALLHSVPSHPPHSTGHGKLLFIQTCSMWMILGVRTWGGMGQVGFLFTHECVR